MDFLEILDFHTNSNLLLLKNKPILCDFIVVNVIVEKRSLLTFSCDYMRLVCIVDFISKENEQYRYAQRNKWIKITFE